jgi:hypothetical protein
MWCFLTSQTALLASLKIRTKKVFKNGGGIVRSLDDGVPCYNNRYANKRDELGGAVFGIDEQINWRHFLG